MAVVLRLANLAPLTTGEVVEAAPALPNLIVGPLTIAIGIAVIRYRVEIHRNVIQQQRWLVGDTVARRLERLQHPFWIGFVGISTILMGIHSIGYGVVKLVSDLS
ncbi:hypothetical protein [Microbacterium schleiferi]|uniref:hypothetical protein n=1 Tax=Microbacterium schleiferi TaxID=69362 RepID=UPI00311E7917